MKPRPKRLALVVEGTTGHAHTILDALGRGDPDYEVILKDDEQEALDYLLRRGAYAGRDAEIRPYVTLLDSCAAPFGWAGAVARDACTPADEATTRSRILFCRRTS